MQPVEYRSSWSCWNVGDRASMKISTDCLITSNNYNWNITPIGISFKCHRKFSCIDSDIYEVFMRAIRGEARQDMVENPHVCSHDRVTGGCGNKRGNLSECRCEVLNRKTNPQIRHDYENRAITKIIEIIKKQNPKFFRLNLAIFCSGGLLGEEILLFRLFDQLRRQDASGTIKLFLIDNCYDQAIKMSSIYQQKVVNMKPSSIDEALGNQMDLKQFLIEICKSVQPSVIIEGTVFGKSEDYIERAGIDASFRHDLIIGADIEQAQYVMGNISQRAGVGEKPIVLVKTNQPLVCQLDISGNLENCYTPYQNSQADAQPIYKHNHQQNSGCAIL